MSGWVVVVVLLLAALGFAGAGIVYSRGIVGGLEDYITARSSVGTPATAATLVASGMGAWILFSPAEAATQGGLPAIMGYALGAAAPLLVFIPLGKRIRRVMPEGHTLTEYVFNRYGQVMYLFTLAVILFYMFIFLAAEITGMALIASLIAGVPLWITALIVICSTLVYTTYGGLKASIFTDVVQSVLILPLLAAVVVVGSLALGGLQPITTGLAERAPELIEFGNLAGIEQGIALFIAVLAPNFFHQGYWQRVYAARGSGSLRNGLLVAAVVVTPVVLAMGFFGLAAAGLNQAQTPSVALFSVLLGALPQWLVVGLVILGLTLVMSSADSLLNGITSIVAVDLRRVIPRARTGFLLRASRLSTLVLAAPLFLIAAQGYSVLYLFLVADLVCAAAAFPVFYGLYSERYTGRAAASGVLAALVTGGLLFPDPAMTRGSLLWSFVVAAVVSVVVSLALTPRQVTFELGTLSRAVRHIDD